MSKYIEPKGYITPAMKKILDAGKIESKPKAYATKGNTKQTATKKK